MCACDYNFVCSRCRVRDLDRDDEPRTPAEILYELLRAVAETVKR